MTRIGIYGGSFSPPHNGHLQAARAFMEQMWLDILYVIPAATPPHKMLDASASAKQRLDMCRLAFGKMDGVYVSDMEMARGGISYTVDTLRELSGQDRRLFLLCGTDMVLTFDKWYRFEDIFKLCYPTYVRREKDPLLDARIVAKIGEYYQKYGVMFRKILVDPITLASTEIRQAVRENKDVSSMIPPRVEHYIREHRLYIEESQNG